MKKFVAVTAHYDVLGRITPVLLWWEDGRRFEIDRVSDVRRAASLKAGGQGMRYTCRILGKERYLYLDGQQWFVEAPDQSGG